MLSWFFRVLPDTRSGLGAVQVLGLATCVVLLGLGSLASHKADIVSAQAVADARREAERAQQEAERVRAEVEQMSLAAEGQAATWLSDEQREVFRARLAVYAGLHATVEYLMDDPASVTLAADLVRVLTEAGWRVESRTVAPEAAPSEGIAVVVKDLDTISLATSAVVLALQEIGVEVAGLEDPNLPLDSFVLRVGRKASNSE